MKKTLRYCRIFALQSIALMALSTNVMAAEGGWRGPGMQPVSVAQAKQMKDDANVVLHGKILQNLGGEDYLFSDGTDTVRLEIEHHLWNGQEVTPEDVIEVHGEVDRDWNGVEIESKRIRLLK